MASAKKRRKQAKAQQRKQYPRTGPHRHPDGDRRHREAAKRAKGLIAEQQALRQLGALPLPDSEEE
jgi:hypothetical protein